MHPTSETDIASLKATLCAQQTLLQKLYDELDAEREASASATSEALSVILRLQGEKAAVKMEAEQYKRLSEAKMLHAEESLAITEDIICQKETEISALNTQVQAYRQKLMKMGCCVDFGGNNLRLRRRFSEPIDSYEEQIRKLDVRVKEISNNDGFDHPCSPSIHDVFEVPQIHRKLSSLELEEEEENGVATKELKSKDSIKCCVAVVGLQKTSNVSESGHGKEVGRMTESTNREEEFKLLNEIKESLSYLHEEVKGLKVKKLSKNDDWSLRTLSEAMPYFWM